MGEGQRAVPGEPEGPENRLRFVKRIAREHGLTATQVQALLVMIGNDPRVLASAAQRLKGSE